MKIASHSMTKAIIKKYDFLFKKKFGQNFLTDQHVLDKIIESSNISEKDVVIEIGPGIGSLTQPLLENACKVIAVEIDKKLIPILEDTLSGYDNLKIINEDILKVDIQKIIDDYPNNKIKVVANLPYNITTPIVMKLLEEKYNIDSITIMIQKEVAQRMQASPGTKDYGALSLAVQYYSEPIIVANVPPNSFIPRPNVDSAVIKLDVLQEASVFVSDEKLMFNIIKLSFGQRRKTLVNAIFNQGSFELSKDELGDIIEKCGFSRSVRGERFSLSDFAKITEELKNNI